MRALYLPLSKYAKPFKQRELPYIFTWKNKIRDKGNIGEGNCMNPLGIQKMENLSPNYSLSS